MSQSRKNRINNRPRGGSRKNRVKNAPTAFELLEQGKAAFLSGRALNAVWLAERAIAMIEKESPDSELLAEALEQRAAYSFVSGKRTNDSKGQRRIKQQHFTNSQDDAERALSIRITLLGTDDHADLTIKHHNLGVFYTGNDQWAPARWHYERTEILGDKYREKDDVGFAHSLNHLGFVYLQLEQFDLAEAALKKALAWINGIPVEKGEEEQRQYDVEVITSQLGLVNEVRAQRAAADHVHGPDCHHDHAETEHQHGPECHHDHAEHQHGPDCGHDHAVEIAAPSANETAAAPAPEANAAAQQWFLQHHEEVPKAKWYAVGSDGLIAHGNDLEAVKALVTDTGRSLEDKSLLFVCICGEGGCGGDAQDKPQDQPGSAGDSNCAQ